jgi:hypothetical protein
MEKLLRNKKKSEQQKMINELIRKLAKADRARLGVFACVLTGNTILVALSIDKNKTKTAIR